MSQARIQFSPDILRRLGEELNPSPSQGIIELVKNAYDADAINCTVKLIDTDQPGGTIIVEDNGDGMRLEDIEKGWLVLGSSGKDPTRRTERFHRIPAGSKGLGRLAALRLGTKVELMSHPRKESSSYKLLIDWSKYDNVHVVEDVSLNIEPQKRPQIQAIGTTVRVENLREPIGRMEVKRLARALILLSDPFIDNQEGFRPTLDAPEFKDFETLVSGGYFSEADFHLHAEVDKHGIAKTVVKDWKGSVLYSAGHKEIRKKNSEEKYECPPATFDLWAFILTKSAFNERNSTLKEVRDWLGAFGGVHLYEGGLRVAPYGNPGNDWLDMNLARSRSPEDRPSTNTSIGRVKIPGGQLLLKQKTDRSGFIESDEFIELRRFAQDALEWMARERHATAEKRRQKNRITAPKKTEQRRIAVQKAIEAVPEKYRTEIVETVHKLDKAHEREVSHLKAEVQLYRTLATVGITAATFAHEAQGNPLKTIATSVETLDRRAKKFAPDHYNADFEPSINRIKRSIDSLMVLGSTTLGLVKKEKRRVGRVEIHQVIKRVVEIFKPFLDGRNVRVDTSLCQGSPYLQASEAAIESIVTNLLNNGLTALLPIAESKRRIAIRTTIEDDNIVLSVLDSGTGIKDISTKSIWLPGETTKSNGTGLGLTIVRDTVKDLGGRVDVVANSELGGAEFKIFLPIIGA